MRRVATLVTCGMGCLLLALVLPLQFQAALRAQQPAPGSAQEPFRASADVIQLDVSVLDKNHRPVAGLTAADFTVMENGKPQRIVGVTPIEVQDVDPRLSAWMRLIPRDVSANEMLDIAGEGRLVGILVDDRTLPFDDADTAISV